MEERTEQQRVRRKKMEDLEQQSVDPFGHRFERNASTEELRATYGDHTKEDLEDEEIPAFRIAGRIMTKRGKGKAGFAHIMDETGQLQIYVRKDDLSENEFDLFLQADLGDIIGVEGKIMRTRMGELTLRVSTYKHLVKALRPLPEKYHGLKDVEERYRRRYLDLLTNQETRETFLVRSKTLEAIREFMKEKGYMEVETPILHPVIGGAAARPFKTYHNTLEMSFFLRIAPELYLKRLLVGGFEKVYEIGRTFRNEGISTQHNPEFTMMELYEAYGDMETMMDLTEEMFRVVAKKVLDRTSVEIDSETVIDLAAGFERVHMADLVKDKLGIDFRDEDLSYEEARAFAEEKGLEIPGHFQKKGHILNLLYEHFVEVGIVQPTFVYGHPVEISPLAKKSKKDPRFTDRFEIIINRREYGNAFTELNNPIDQKTRFEAQLEERDLGNVEANEMDTDYIEALEHGMPPAGGLGVGIDRLVMLLAKAKSIRDVILFPHMRQRT